MKIIEVELLVKDAEEEAGSAFERSHTKPFTKVNCSYSQAGVNTYEHLPYPAVNTLFIQCSYSVHTAK